MKTITLLACFLFTSLCIAQNDQPQREAFSLKLAVDGEKYYGMEVQKAPYFVKEKILQIYPGDKLFIETEIKNDTIFSMKVVKENKYPTKTIELEFTQETEAKAHGQMILSIKNPFNRTLKYEALMYRVGGEKFTSTSIIPVMPGISSYETWQDIIITLILENWTIEK